MSVKMFDSPVFLKDGEHIIQEVACLEDALEFLYEWPKKRRGTIYNTALRACQRAFDSDYPLTAAREAFTSFARWARILEDVSTPLPWMVAPGAGRGGLPA